MGIYDTVKCKRIMPDGLDGAKHEFQTKDLLYKYMADFEITEDNKLYSNGNDIEFHGVFDMCTHDDTMVFREYRVKFTDGLLQSIIVLSNES
jgi:hypothetical protein